MSLDLNTIFWLYKLSECHLGNMASLIPYKGSCIHSFPGSPRVREGPRSCFPGWAALLSHCQLLLLMLSPCALSWTSWEGLPAPRALCTPGCRSSWARGVSFSSLLTELPCLFGENERISSLFAFKGFSFSACASDSLSSYLLLSSFLLVWGKGNVLSL